MNALAGNGRPARAADVLCGAALTAGQTWAILSVLLIPAWIGTRPVALEVVNGSLLSVAAAGAFVRVGRAGLVVALMAPLALWLPVDIASWWTGRRFGPRAAGRIVLRRPRIEIVVARSERLLDRHRVTAVILAPWLPVPSALLFVASGWRRLPLPLFIAADAAGTLAFNSLVLLLGYGAGGHVVSLARRISDFAASLTAVLAVVLLGMFAVNALRLRRARASEISRQPGLAPDNDVQSRPDPGDRAEDL
jgi:membrane protein DedA with SNARE-associated domain